MTSPPSRRDSASRTAVLSYSPFATAWNLEPEASVSAGSADGCVPTSRTKRPSVDSLSARAVSLSIDGVELSIITRRGRADSIRSHDGFDVQVHGGGVDEFDFETPRFQCSDGI